MDLKTYYSILEWQGENPTKIDPSTGKEFGRKIYEKDIELGKTVWANNKCQDWLYYILYHDPFLSLISNLNQIECHEIFMILLFLLNVSLILATMTASIGFNGISNLKFNHIASDNPYKSTSSTIHSAELSMNDRLSMIICACFNGLIICICTLKWRRFETKHNRKLSTFIMNQNGITVFMLILCALCLMYYFLTNDFYFYSWFLTIYALQFIFGWIFEILTLYISFIRGWKYDQEMMKLIPHYFGDGSFSHCALPKCVYYITFKDYQEWIQYTQKRETSSSSSLSLSLSSHLSHDDEQIDKPLLLTTNNDENETENNHPWLP